MLTSSNHQQFIAVHTSVARNLSHALKQQHEPFRRQLNNQCDPRTAVFAAIIYCNYNLSPILVSTRYEPIIPVFSKRAILVMAKISNIDR